MIYFLSIYLAVAALSLTDFVKKWRTFGAVLCVLLLAMLAGWRNMGGRDFFVYQDIYYGFSLNYFSSEMGYALANNIFSGLGFSFNAFLFCYSLTAIAIIVLFLEKHSSYPKLALLIYMGCYFFFYNMVLCRQMLCISLALWIIYWWDRKPVYSLLCLMLGCTFHQSILVLLPFLCAFEFLHRTKGIRCWVLFFICVIGLAAIFSPEQMVIFLGKIPGLSFIPQRVLGYLTRADGSYSLNIVEYIKIIICLPLILFSLKRILRENRMHIWLFMYFVGIVFLMWTRNDEILFRLFAYFDLSLLVLLPFCIKYFVQRCPARQRGLILTTIYGGVGLLATAAILYRTAHFENAVFWDYQFYFLL